MPNQYKNKVVYGNNTLIDLTGDTVSAADVAQGKLFHLPTGEQAVGTATGSSVVTVIETPDINGGIVKDIIAVDISSDTVDAAHLLSGYTAHDSSGTAITGTFVPSSAVLQNKTVNVSPTESAQSQTVSADVGYDGLDEVEVNVGAISSSYVGSGITRRSSSDLSASGATVTVPAGYYENSGTKSVSSGSATAPASISGTSATVSTGTNTLTLSKSVSVTPTVSAGYVSTGTAGNASVSLTANVTTKGAATITPGTSNQTIASGTYLTGTQTIAGDADLVGANIISSANIFGVQGTVVIQHYYTGSSAPSSSLGSNGDIYLQT